MSEAYLNPEEQLRYKQEKAHELYLGCKEVLPGSFCGDILNSASSPEEERFYVAVANFFLQEKQRELIADGVF